MAPPATQIQNLTVRFIADKRLRMLFGALGAAKEIGMNTKTANQARHVMVCYQLMMPQRTEQAG